MNACDPHHNEYLAAISNLHEQTPSLRPEPAVGDFVSGTTDGKRWSGHVEWLSDDGRMCIRGDGWWAYVPVKDITH